MERTKAELAVNSFQKELHLRCSKGPGSASAYTIFVRFNDNQSRSSLKFNCISHNRTLV